MQTCAITCIPDFGKGIHYNCQTKHAIEKYIRLLHKEFGVSHFALAMWQPVCFWAYRFIQADGDLSYEAFEAYTGQSSLISGPLSVEYKAVLKNAERHTVICTARNEYKGLQTDFAYINEHHHFHLHFAPNSAGIYQGYGKSPRA